MRVSSDSCNNAENLEGGQLENQRPRTAQGIYALGRRLDLA